MKAKGITWAKGLSGCMAVLFSLSAGTARWPMPVSAAGTEPAAEIQTSLNDSAEDSSYYSYMRLYETEPCPVVQVLLPADEALLDGQPVSAPEAQIEQAGTLEWTINVPETGRYRIAVQYRYTELTGLNNVEYGLRINGEYPFEDAASLTLRRIWENGDGITQDTLGNDLKPLQEQTDRTVWTDLADEKGVVSEYSFYLQAGETRLSFEWAGGGIAVCQAKLYNPEIVAYTEYNGSHPSDSNVVYYKAFQAEANLYTNDSSLVPSADRTGPATVPSHPTQLRLNVLSSSSYKMPGQTVTWEVEVPETGVYALGIRYQQADQQGLIVSRRVLIDGEVPFEELSDVAFAYTDVWKYRELGEGETPYEIYLTQGKHTLTLQVVPGEMGVQMQRLENVVYALNEAYRKIIMITSTTPDVYRDYSLEVEIPELLPTFAEQITEMQDIQKSIEAITGQKGGQTSCLSQTVYQLQSFIEKPYNIATRLDAYKSNVTALSSLMNLLRQQPLSIDYVTLRGMGSEPVETEASFFEKLSFEIQKFIGSFFSDYETVGSASQTQTTESIRVWYSGGRENAEILKQLFDMEFTSKYGIGVNLQLVQIPLSQAILAGREPDVVLNVSRSDIVNFAARGVMQPLDELDGFDELTGRFLDNAFVPYSFGGHVYGIPVTLSFHMMFCRTDILSELGLSYPETWDEFYALIPKLQRANLAIGVPVATKTYSTSLGTDDIFATLLLQNGGQIYNEEGSRVTLDDSVAIDTFRQWTDLYTQYKFDKEFDFYNRFRTGEMPLGIAGYQTYNMLEATAPELQGLWEMVPIPGTRREDGTIDRTELGSGSGTIVTKESKHKDAAWEFVKWWTDTEAQAAYGRNTEQLLGTASRYNPACVEAIYRLPWTDEEKAALQEQMDSVTEVQEVVGGYYTARGINNAFRSVVLNGQNYREALMEQTLKINQELIRKRKELDLE